MELRIALISLLVVFFVVIISEAEAGRHRKIIIHVPVKYKKTKHTHTLVKPVHVHHKPTIIKEKVIKQEIHKPAVEVHKEEQHIIKPIEYKKKEYKPIYKEEISHEHLHHHYKHVHPEVKDHYHHHHHNENSNESFDSGNGEGFGSSFETF